MATQTSKLKLTKPAYTDTADIMPINVNMDIIDSKFVEVDNEINSLKNKNTSQDTEIDNLKNAINGIKLEAENVSIKDTANNFASTNVEGALSELFQDVDNGKELIASAIVDKGVSASKTDTYPVLADKIRNISGIDIIARSSLPSTGRENQVCVITDINPKNIEVGHFDTDFGTATNTNVYIQLDSVQTLAQNILLKDSFNSIKLWLKSCVQVVNGVEEYRRVYKYVAGKWVLVLDIPSVNSIELYTTELGYHTLFGTLQKTNSVAGSLQVTENGIEIETIGDGLATVKSMEMSSTKSVDVTNYNNLTVEFRANSQEAFGVSVNNKVVEVTNNDYVNELTLDISNIVGSHKINFFKHVAKSNSYCTITRITLSK